MEPKCPQGKWFVYRARCAVNWERQGEVGDFVEVNAQRIATGAEITALTTTTSSDNEILIIAGTEDRVVELAQLDFNAKLTPIFSVQLASTIPAALAFAENDEDVMVFGLRDGDMWVASVIQRYG